MRVLKSSRLFMCPPSGDRYAAILAASLIDGVFQDRIQVGQEFSGLASHRGAHVRRRRVMNVVNGLCAQRPRALAGVVIGRTPRSKLIVLQTALGQDLEAGKDRLPNTVESSFPLSLVGIAFPIRGPIQPL